MKNLFLILYILPIGMLNAQNTRLASPEYLLDGYRFNYQYQSGNAIHIEFADGEMTYQWIAGRQKGKAAKTIPYQSRQIGENMYLVNWHEADEKNFITLVFNLSNRVVSSSVIVNYQSDEPRIAFEGGVIEHVSVGNEVK